MAQKVISIVPQIGKVLINSYLKKLKALGWEEPVAMEGQPA